MIIAAAAGPPCESLPVTDSPLLLLAQGSFIRLVSLVEWLTAEDLSGGIICAEIGGIFLPRSCMPCLEEALASVLLPSLEPLLLSLLSGGELA